MNRNRDPEPFIVRGTGAFPFDMLRYDEAFPATSADASNIGMETRDVRARDSRRTVRLLTYRMRGPTIGRWESFGWTVVSHDAFGRLSDEDIEARLAATPGRQLASAS